MWGKFYLMDNESLDKYSRLKRRMYLVIFPIFFVTNLYYWLFSSYIDRITEIVLPSLCLFLLIVWLFIFFKRFMRTCELVTLVVFGLYHLFRVYSMASKLEDGEISLYLFWSTAYFIYIFIVLDRKRALSFALFIFSITIVIGIPHFYSVKVNDILIQYYAITLIYIIVLFYFQRMIHDYIESDVLKKAAYYDFLTNIGNRRLIDKWLDERVKLSQHSNVGFSIIYFDIDNFKSINDKYGHDVGDYVLKEVTSLVKSCLLPTDLFGRWGGEEFIIISKNKTIREATHLAEKLRKRIETHSFRYVDHITSSFGVSSFQPNDIPKTIVKRADQALYMAKKNGRNKVQTR